MELEHERSDRSNCLDSLGTEVWELLQLGSAPCLVDARLLVLSYHGYKAVSFQGYCGAGVKGWGKLKCHKAHCCFQNAAAFVGDGSLEP